MVIKEHDVELDILLEAGDDFLGHHEIRAIADQHINLAAGIRHFDAQPTGDFITHT